MSKARKPTKRKEKKEVDGPINYNDPCLKEFIKMNADFEKNSTKKDSIEISR